MNPICALFSVLALTVSAPHAGTNDTATERPATERPVARLTILAECFELRDAELRQTGENPAALRALAAKRRVTRLHVETPLGEAARAFDGDLVNLVVDRRPHLGGVQIETQSARVGHALYALAEPLADRRLSLTIQLDESWLDRAAPNHDPDREAARVATETIAAHVTLADGQTAVVRGASQNGRTKIVLVNVRGQL